MQTNEIYTLNHGLIPVPNKWIIPGLDKIEGNIDAFEFIINMVCSKYEQTEKAVMALSRKREIVKSRQIIHTLLKENFYKLSLNQIGHRCGNKDHATVIHSCKSVNDQRDTNRAFKEEYEEFDNIIKNNIKSFKQTHLKLNQYHYV